MLFRTLMSRSGAISPPNPLHRYTASLPSAKPKTHVADGDGQQPHKPNACSGVADQEPLECNWDPFDCLRNDRRLPPLAQRGNSAPEPNRPKNINIER